MSKSKHKGIDWSDFDVKFKIALFLLGIIIILLYIAFNK